MNYYEHHLGDYLRDTAHLSALEDGIYRRLLDAYYIREKPLPSDQRECCKSARAMSKTERNAVAYVLESFFTLEADGYHQARADAEIARYSAKREKAKQSSALGVAARTGRITEGSTVRSTARSTERLTEGATDGQPLQSPVTSLQTPEEQETAPMVPPGPARSSAPALPPSAFDGLNDEELNGKAVVPLSATFKLSEEWGTDAVALGWKPGEALTEAEKFRQYWTAGRGAGTRRSVKGWRQSWSNWLGKAAERKR